MTTQWTEPEIAPIREVLIPKRGLARLPVPLPASPRGELPAGLADFRGFPLTEAAMVAIADADFTAARAPRNQSGVEQSIQFRNVAAERSVFDRAGKFSRIDGQFTGCSFQKITTRSCSIAGVFTDCDFSGSNFKAAHFNARFIRCRFQNCNLHLASWPSSFQDCEFTGAAIHELFADVRTAATAAERVTFTVTMSSVLPGVFR